MLSSLINFAIFICGDNSFMYLFGSELHFCKKFTAVRAACLYLNVYDRLTYFGTSLNISINSSRVHVYGRPRRHLGGSCMHELVM